MPSVKDSINPKGLFYPVGSLRLLDKPILDGRNIHQSIPLDSVDRHLVQHVYRILIRGILRGLDNYHEILRIGSPLLVEDNIPYRLIVGTL